MMIATNMEPADWTEFFEWFSGVWSDMENASLELQQRLLEEYVQSAFNIWNIFMGLVSGLATMTPEEFSGEAWYFVTTQITPITMGLGAACLNVFFLANLVRQTTNLKEQYTLEILVEHLIYLLLANMLILNGKTLMSLLFKMAGRGAGLVLRMDGMNFVPIDIDTGSRIFVDIFGILFFIVSAVCGGMIFFAFYRRYLQLYALTALMPVALSTMAGGRGVNNTASAWFKTFLASCFEVMVMALVLSVGAAMSRGIDFGSVAAGLGIEFDGAMQMIQSMVTMISLAAFVMGIDTFMRRALAL